MNFSKELSGIITQYFVPFLCVGAICLALVVGIRFAMAKNEKERQEARKRLFSMISVCLIFIVISGIQLSVN